MANPINIELLHEELPEHFDLVICSASFESRCQKLVEALNKKIKCNCFLVSYNSNEYQEINDMASELITKLPNAHGLELNTDSPVQNAIAINKKLDELFQEPIENLFLDITTFTHETLLIIYKMIHEKKAQFKNLFIGYIGAKEYSVNEPVLEKKWLSSGISMIRSVVGYPGVNSPARKNHLIVLVGFESQRTQSLIDVLQFDTISLGIGHKDDSIELCHLKLNHESYLELMRKYTNADQFCFSLTNPSDAEKHIVEQIEKFPNHNTVIAPMNNKLSTIGASLTAINNPKIQLIYAKPREYNFTGYSEPSNDVYIFKMNSLNN
jgi:hypothetical protein